MSYRPLPATLLATLTLKKKQKTASDGMIMRHTRGENLEWSGLYIDNYWGGGGCGREGELGTLNFRQPGMSFWNGSRERPGHHSSYIRRGFATQRCQP